MLFTMFDRLRLHKTMNKEDNIVKVHAGCGNHLLPGWINCDIKGNVDTVWDLNDKPPFEYNSVDYLFSEHVMEHFTLDEGVNILVNFRKILKPGGKLRITVPDLRSCIDSYLTGYGYTFRNEHQKQLSSLRVNAEYLNKCFREHGHKFLYDEEALTYVIQRAGFINTKRFKPLKSKDTIFKGVERRIKNLNSSQHSLCIEAIKKKS